MNADDYTAFTKKKLMSKKPRSKPLPKATQLFLEAEETLKQELWEFKIGFEHQFQPIHTKHWRFDFHIVKLRLLIEIVGGPWSGGRSGKLANKAWSMDRYNRTEDLGYKIERIGPDAILSGFMIHQIKVQLEKLDDGTNQTIPAD